MGREFTDDDGDIDSRTVLDALGDEICRTLIAALAEPRTASELSERCDVPLSTTYRKLESLVDAGLLEERTEVRSDGHHTTRYVRAFEGVAVSVDGSDTLSVAVSRSPTDAGGKLATLWSEVRKET